MILYLDTSALIKLYVEESKTEEVRDAAEEAKAVAVSEIGYVEARSALSRKEREGFFSAEEHDKAVDQLERDFQEVYLSRTVTGTIVARAGDLTRQYALRAYEAVHLATALKLREEARELRRDQEQPTEELQVWLLCYDLSMHEAAQTEGLAHERGSKYYQNDFTR